ncbi:MAG: GTPase HflX [Lachnospiraceae bacterium]|nr:GTPase HflX [Lachnospiraceae bacterium]
MKQEEYTERAVLAGVEVMGDGKEGDLDRSMEELGNLAKACFIEPVAVVTQRMESVHKGLYMGKGKVQELKDVAEKLDADLILFDNSLTPSQLRNLQEELGKPVMDRTTLILDIFDSRARTREAKLQVETARLQYLLPRLVGMHEALTRQGGTSGSMSSRGAGEKKLELDRRKIEHRLTELKKELEQVAGERRVQRKRRQESGIPMVALVGYTNAGKSTIMNRMVEAYVKDEEKKVLEKDMLFATLDTSVRRINTGNNRDFLLSDTVGFIHKLPHDLVKAFRSTLEEACRADLLLQVVDCSDPFYQEQMKTTAQTLTELGAGDIPMLTVYNKADLGGDIPDYPKRIGDRLYICAKQEASLLMLTEAVLEKVYSDFEMCRFLIPYDKGNIVSYLRENTQLLSQDYREEGTELVVKCHRADKNKFSEYVYGKRAVK